MSIYQEFKPTWLYVKIHALTGKLYLGMTTKQDPDKYRGSGKRWKRHIKKHGERHVLTIWKQFFTDKTELVAAAQDMSRRSDVVKSPHFLNLQEESGIDGWTPGKRQKPSHTAKIAAANRGKTRKPYFLNSATNKKRVEAIGRALKGRKKSKNHKAKLTLCLDKHLKRVPVSANGEIFRSAAECAIAHGITNQGVCYRIKSTSQKFINWKTLETNANTYNSLEKS